MGKKSKDFLAKNIVSILFAVMCVGAFFASKVSFSYFLQELITRIVRNSVLVLALIIPVITGPRRDGGSSGPDSHYALAY